MGRPVVLFLCALARKECVAVATALGASVLQAERYFDFFYTDILSTVL